jgi:hypothetical protein
MEGLLPTAGERLAIRCPQGWIARRILEGADGCFIPGPPDAPTVRVCVDPVREPFPVAGWTRLSRDAWCRDGRVMVRDVATSGFDLLAWRDGPVPDLVLRWRPPRRTRAAALMLRKRARLLAQAVLLQYPALWAASLRGRAPLHAAALTAGSHGTALLVGPSGVGKTTLVTEEPVRGDQPQGRRELHGRRAMHLSGRVPVLEPTVLVVLGRGTGYRVEACDPETASRALIASTYAAGELRRYWGVHALLALGTGAGPAHPQVAKTAAAFAERLRCLQVELPKVRGERLAERLATEGAEAWM